MQRTKTNPLAAWIWIIDATCKASQDPVAASANDAPKLESGWGPTLAGRVACTHALTGLLLRFGLGLVVIDSLLIWRLRRPVLDEFLARTYLSLSPEKANGCDA